MKRRLARYIKIKNSCSVYSVCEHPEHIPFVHSPSIVITHALSAHSLITMSTYVHLPIISSIAVLYYSATPCSICTVESDRNIRSPSNISCPQEILFPKCLIPPTGENRKSFLSVLEFLPCAFAKTVHYRLSRNRAESLKVLKNVSPVSIMVGFAIWLFWTLLNGGN